MRLRELNQRLLLRGAGARVKDHYRASGQGVRIGIAERGAGQYHANHVKSVERDTAPRARVDVPGEHGLLAGQSNLRIGEARAGIDIGGAKFGVVAGQVILLSQWVTHRLPGIWGADALAFRPERFDPESPQDVPQFAYFPFGGGPRMCIGMPFAQMEARLLLATIGQRFIPWLVPGQHIVPLPMVTLRPKYGIKVTLEAN